MKTLTRGALLGLAVGIALAVGVMGLARAQTPACSVDNKDAQPCIRVQIKTLPQTKDVEFGFRFTDVDDATVDLTTSNFTLEDQAGANVKDFVKLGAGRYRVTGDAAAGWRFVSIDCQVGAGGDADVTYNLDANRATVDLTSGRVVCVYTAVQNPTPVPTATATATSTPVPPTATPVLPTNTPVALMRCDDGSIVNILFSACPTATPVLAVVTPAPTSTTRVTPPNTGDAGLK